MRSSGLVLFTCAGLLLSGGTVLGGATTWILLRISYYFWTTDLGVELGAGVLFIVGSLLCLPACWLCTVVPYNTKSHSLMATLMALVSVSMILLSFGLTSAATVSHAVREPSALNASMLRALTRVHQDPAVKSSFAAMQLELRCCGVNSPSDWVGGDDGLLKYGLSLPAACCGRVWNGKRGDRCEAPLYKVGCLQIALLELRAYINSVCTLGAAIIMVLGVTLFTAAYMVVTSVVEPAESYKPPQPLRIACLAQPPLVSLASSLQTPPFVPPQLQPTPIM